MRKRGARWLWGVAFKRDAMMALRFVAAVAVAVGFLVRLSHCEELEPKCESALC